MNGWTNYETWLFVLWWIDYLESYVCEMWDEGNNDIENISTIEETIKNVLYDYEDVHIPQSSFLSDVFYGFISQVNFHEIANHIKDTLEYHIKEVIYEFDN